MRAGIGVVDEVDVGAGLATRERAGAQTAEMAQRLFLSPDTIKSHIQNAMSKLGARTRAHAVAIALVTGQIAWSDEPPPPSASA